MTKAEASLIARLQCALIGEGVHHWMESEEQAVEDGNIIRLAVVTAWPTLRDWERRTLRHWHTSHPDMSRWPSYDEVYAAHLRGDERAGVVVGIMAAKEQERRNGS